ncbi:MAG: ABC transporter substrate-binding protein [Candidatus ainarchaeum sp.]|nr:ABC transporter substrate-binding protein [Candidatus ainarchaeum sp.]
MKTKILFLIGIIALAIAFSGCAQQQGTQGEIKIGFIGPITGPMAKYGAFEAVQLAVEEINSNGGINGVPVKMIFEDAKCDAKEAVNSMNKLINVDGVKVILGGHCSPESLAIAPIAEQNKVVMLASITTTPSLSKSGEYVFRTSPVGTQQVPLMTGLLAKLKAKKLAIVFEQTDYAAPIAEKLKNDFTASGGKVVSYDSYTPGTTDFRTILSKIMGLNPDVVFLSPQNPDAGFMLVKQMKELGMAQQILGNDVMGNVAAFIKNPELHEGIIFPSPSFNPNNPKSKEFMDKYRARYGSEISYGFWTSESYDAVYIIADAIKQKGLDVEGIRQYLYNLKDFEGASGKLAIDANGDGIRGYELLIVKADNKVEEYQ